MALLGLGSDTLLLVLLVAGPLIGFYGVYQLVADLRHVPKKKVMGRLKGQINRGAAEAQRFNFEDLRKEAPKAVGMLGQAFAKFSFTERLQTTLEQANVPWSASRLLGSLTLIASVLLAVMIALKLPILVSLGAAAAAYVLPVLYLGHRRRSA